MLIAQDDNGRIDASAAGRGSKYICPNCLSEVVLKRGRIVIPHFAHKAPVTCEWGSGETQAHLEAKRLFAEAFAARGLRVEIEHVVPSLPSYRRADIMVWTKRGRRVAVELQHTPIGLDEIEERAFAYARAEITQVWIPFLSHKVWAQAERITEPTKRTEYVVERYPARPFERWIH